MIVICDALGCVHGIVHRGPDWADPCAFCGGFGGVTLTDLSKRIGEHYSTLKRVVSPRDRMRPRTAARILDKLLALRVAA